MTDPDADAIRQLLGDLFHPDIEMAVLRAHSWCEAHLSEQLRRALPQPEALFPPAKRPKVQQFWLKVALAQALGILDERQVDGLIGLSEARNRLAHNAKARVDDTQATELIKKIGEPPEAFCSTPIELEALPYALGYLVREMEGLCDDILRLEPPLREDLTPTDLLE